MNPKSLVKYIQDLKIMLVALVFYFSAWLGYVLAFEGTTALPTWPPSGIAFALIILLGRTAWPGIVIGSLLANLMAYWNSPGLPAHAIIGVSCMIAGANAAEALIGNFLVKNWIKNDYPFTVTRDAFRFLFVAIVMSVCGAAIGATGMLVNGVTSRNEFLQTALTWAIGNAVAILLFTPFILACFRFMSLPFSRARIIELGVLTAFATGLFSLLQLDYSHPTLERALPFLILPFLLWLAFRFELFIAMGGVISVSLLSIYITIHNDGPFFLDEPAYSMPLIQIFISVMSVSAIVLSATVRERTDAQDQLLEFTETLEAKVHARTKALHDEINTRTIAELRLQKTNQELSKRNSELDNFVYSVSHDLRAPIASVLGLINLAKKDADPTMKDVYLDMINNSAKLQDHFIREILDQSRNSRLEVKREEIFFQPIIEETFNQLRFASASDQGVERIINVKQEKAFYCDSWRLKVILNNIISNAIRYRNGKDPVIQVDVDVDKEGAQLRIKDNGRGIAREHLDNVCKMFYRATDDGAGSGLGLYIVKETIDKLNGSINIDSELGKGTMVKLKIPEVV